MSSGVEILDKIEMCIKKGHFSRAQALFKKIRIKDIPRKQALRSSSLARRCGKTNTSLKILNPIVRTNEALLHPAKPEEVVDYAFSLHRVGATVEAKKLLDSMDLNLVSQAPFFYSIILFSSWDYEKAIPLLESYIVDERLDDYKKAIGKANLASALIFVNRIHEAQNLIDEVLEYSRQGGFSLLENLSHELQAQLYMSQNDYKQAVKCLKGDISPGSSEYKSLELWAKKWLAIANASRSPSSKTRADLLKVQKSAQVQGQFEVVRDCDFYLAKIFEDMERAEKLFFGTPHKSYLQRIQRLSGFKAPGFYNLKFGDNPDQFVLDLSTFESQNSEVPMLFSKLDKQLLLSLTRDFYKPMSLGSLFGSLFSEDYYNPFHSPNRVYQTVFRSNEKFLKLGMDLQVGSDSFGYHLQSEQGTTLKVFRGHGEKVMSPMMKKLKNSFSPNQEFSLYQLQEVSDLSRRSLQRFVKEQVEEGALQKTGKGRSTKYKIVA